MRALEVNGQVDEQGRLIVEPLPAAVNGLESVKVIVLYPDDAENDPDNMSTEEVEADLRIALQQAKNGETMSLDQMWAELEENQQ